MASELKPRKKSKCRRRRESSAAVLFIGVRDLMRYASNIAALANCYGVIGASCVGAEPDCGATRQQTDGLSGSGDEGKQRIRIVPSTGKADDILGADSDLQRAFVLDHYGTFACAFGHHPFAIN